MKTVAIISDHASPLADPGGVDSGGQNVYVAHVARNLAQLGYRVDIFTRRDDESLPEIYDWLDGIRVIHVPAGPARFVRKEDLLQYMPEFSQYMIDFIQQQRVSYDLLHANFWMSGLVAADVKAALGLPFVITFHALGRVRRQYQGKADGFPDDRLDAEMRIVREADGIVAECPQDKEDLVRFYEADPSRIREIPCGFDPHELWPVNKRAAAREIGLPGDEWTVLQLGRMVPRKGVDTAIRGFAGMLRLQDIPARMLIVGGACRQPDEATTPEIGRLRSIARDEGILDRVTFCGRRSRDELKYYYSAASVFVSTPWYEPFGITPVESMACGTPVIGSRVGGIKHTVVDGETGYLVEPNDSQAIAERLVELHRDPRRLEQFRRQAIQRVNSLFTWRKVSEALASFYESVIAERQLRSAGASYSDGLFRAAEAAEDAALIADRFESSMETLQRSRELISASILDASQLLIECLENGGKILVCGNGGSAADAQHFAAELLGRFLLKERKGLPVLALTADSAFLTAWSNDIGYDQIFSRQVEALGQPGDVLVGFSTSGRSRNVVEAFTLARKNDIKCIGLLGGDGGDLLSLSDAAIVVPSSSTPRIQEVHTLAMHLLSELIEQHISRRLEAAIAMNEAALARFGERSWVLSDASR
jgi:D-inositol-3-phosphate glycosyltransferase